MRAESAAQANSRKASNPRHRGGTDDAGEVQIAPWVRTVKLDDSFLAFRYELCVSRSELSSAGHRFSKSPSCWSRRFNRGSNRVSLKNGEELQNDLQMRNGTPSFLREC